MPLTRALSVEEKPSHSELTETFGANSGSRRKSCTQKADCHVHFHAALEKEDSEGEITLKWRFPDTLDVQLGFLQLFHKYIVHIVVPRRGIKDREVARGNASCSPAVPSNVKITALKPVADAFTTDLTVEVFVATDVFMKEILNMFDEDTGNFTIVFHAQVLSKDKGTPLLKKGIHCIEHFDEDEPEAKHLTANHGKEELS